MRPRQITTHGWSVEDDLRADRIARERGDLRGPTTRMLVLDEVDREPWHTDKTPYMASLMENQNADSPVMRVSMFRPTCAHGKTWKDEL